MLGKSHLQLCAFENAITAFRDALLSAEKTQKAFRDDILTGLRLAKKQQWASQQRANLARHAQAKQQLIQLCERRTADATSKNEADSVVPQIASMLAYLEHTLDRQEESYVAGEIPDYFLCPVSMEVMQDPVTTPNGVSYVLCYGYGGGCYLGADGEL